MMEIPVAIFVIMCLAIVFGLAGSGLFFGDFVEQVLVPRARLDRLEAHDSLCYSHYWEQTQEKNRRIRHLEKELSRVPRAMRSRKTRKLIGS